MCETNYNIFITCWFYFCRHDNDQSTNPLFGRQSLHSMWIVDVGAAGNTHDKIAHLHKLYYCGCTDSNATPLIHLRLANTLHNTADRFHFVTFSFRERCSWGPTTNKICLQVLLCCCKWIRNCNAVGEIEPLTFNSWVEFSGQLCARLEIVVSFNNFTGLAAVYVPTSC